MAVLADSNDKDNLEILFQNSIVQPPENIIFQSGSTFVTGGAGEARIDNEVLSLPRNRKFNKVPQLNRLFLPEGQLHISLPN